MKHKKLITALILTIILTTISSSGVVFAELDYSSWDSQAIYPSDVINTPLMSPVRYLIDKKIIEGYKDGTFKPANAITRAEVATMVAKATNRINDLEAQASRDTFTDLSGYTWAKGYINALADAKIMLGMQDSTFSPGKNISYQELITVLVRMSPSAESVVDGSGSWPTNYIQHVQQFNLMGDVIVTDWTAPATRGDTAKLLYRFLPKTTTTSTSIF